MNRLRDWSIQALRHAPVVLPSLAVLLVGSATLAVAWFVASDVAYVAYVTANVLRARRSVPDAPEPVTEVRWRAFRDRASWAMDNAAAAFVALALATHDTLPWSWPRWTSIALGLLLGAIGLGTKTWAAASLPRANYYWRDVFFPREPSPVSRSGPYRWLSNPMYTLGYAHSYGLAVLVLSIPALVGAVLAQTLILLFNRLVEHPAAAERMARASAPAPAPAARVVSAPVPRL
jgi:protein-S-isoprenylcysteine O-methyltransferase Ste14